MTISIYAASSKGVSPAIIYAAPTIDLVNPISGSAGNLTNTTIELKLEDDTQIDLEGTIIKIDGVPINTVGPFAFTASWSSSIVTPNAGNGYDLALIRSTWFDYGSTVSLQADTTDTTGLTATLSASFTVETATSVLNLSRLGDVNAVTFFLNELLLNAVEKTSPIGSFRGTMEEVFYVYSTDENVTYTIDVLLGSTWYPLTSGTALASVMTPAILDFYVPTARVRIQASSYPTTVTVYAYGQPAKFVRGAL